jgi:hydrogenase nickel incorporation protein HypB
MCIECGCGIVDPTRVGISGPHAHGGHAHGHSHGQPEHGHASQGHQTVSIEKPLLEKNDRQAERNRGFFQAKGMLVINVLSSPGSGKTTLIQKTAEALSGKLRMAVIVGDLATDNDAQRLRQAGLPVVQITTGTVCHLDAEMVFKAMQQMDLGKIDLLVIENVGNLVCPAAYDLGEDLRIVLLAVTEGEDKPLKYPPMFHSAQVVLVTKSDLAEAAGFAREQAMANLQKVSHHAEVLEVSARTGSGMDRWCGWLQQAHLRKSDAAR